jgi:hypothetical protein
MRPHSGARWTRGTLGARATRARTATAAIRTLAANTPGVRVRRRYSEHASRPTSRVRRGYGSPRHVKDSAPPHLHKTTSCLPHARATALRKWCRGRSGGGEVCSLLMSPFESSRQAKREDHTRPHKNLAVSCGTRDRRPRGLSSDFSLSPRRRAMSLPSTVGACRHLMLPCHDGALGARIS